uniref:Uncharacterized protein n=1 Tax=Lactuca sativa TaxID=4236 RepID=A0A9R1XIR8_LACSA|nr:hypothetical protein LSAT_V11C400160220 [Lactuca sativa]
MLHLNDHFTLKQERFRTREILFQSRIAGLYEDCKWLASSSGNCLEHCHVAGLTPDETWFKTIVLDGSTACLPGVVERLEKELHVLLPPSISNGIRVIPPPHGADSTWHGEKLLNNVPHRSIG